ncbi:MAG: hypothetical protein LBS49_00855 [Candidatus Accumulibacter sp.]|jgi:macrolide-specific efflux system membrane fusion protein|nr:hypothetical protein [Accumulibacter sp.]
MTVWTEVSEADVGRLRKDMPVYFTTLGLLDEAGHPRRWNGVLRQVLPAPVPAANTAAQGGAPAGKVVLYTALFDVNNADGALMPQMNAQVFFVLAAARDVLTVPLRLLETVPGPPEVFSLRVLENGRGVPRQVKIGARDRLYGEVVDGIKENDRLVTGIRQQRASRSLRW